MDIGQLKQQVDACTTALKGLVSSEPVPYVDPDAIGTNATAVRYPDGTIVGSTDNGNYVKRPDGTLEMWANGSAQTATQLSGAVYRSDVVLDWVFPIAFPSTDNIFHVSCIPNGVFRWGTLDITDETTIRYRQYGSTDSTSNLPSKLSATGRWK